MKFVIVAYYQTESQVSWSGTRWISDISQADTYETESKARSAFRRLAARANLQYRDRAVVIEDYGLVTERIAYHLDADGIVVAGAPEEAA